ncbi:MAG: NAD-dependent deacetylase [Actinobacteria bacterium]|nr:NAD-dependent deacetylase [Actinomycetota bacterium]
MSVDQAGQLLASASTITVLTGAGISTDSGIPDFRGPQGVWTNDPAAQRMFTLQSYLADPEVRRRAWRARREHPAWAAAPNAAHSALVELERGGVLEAIVTQNIDGLHQAAGSSPERVIEVHGNLHETECLTCGERRPMSEALLRVDAGEQDPPCHRCGGILKSATISFGQSLVREVLAKAVCAAQSCDLFLAVGSSLSVQPVAGLTRLAHEGGARVVIVNAQPTPYDDLADCVLHEPIGAAVPALVGRALAGE